MRSGKLIVTLFISIMSIFITILLLLFPVAGLQAAFRGISIWWDVLFPALFPFFVISELLLGFGIVHFLGTLLDPLMRPLFKVPGIGGFVMAMGFASGYPVGAKLTSQLWDKRLITREEGERLVAFTTNSDPIFLIGAVSIGFFHDAGLAGILAFSHYGASLLVGFIMRFHGKDSNPSTNLSSETKGNIVKRSFHAMHTARMLDGRPLGLLLQQAIQSSLRLIFVVGGLVVFFSVVLELLTLSQSMNLFYIAVQTLLYGFGIPPVLCDAVVNGIFEVTLGAKSAGNVEELVPLVNKAAIACFILSWAGLSVHAQIVSLTHHTGMRYLPFVFARWIHGMIGALLVFTTWDTLQPLRNISAPLLTVFDTGNSSASYLGWGIAVSAIVFIAAILFLLCIFILYLTVNKLFKLARKGK